MARGVNKVILVGNLGADPETRFMPNGNPVTSLSLATSESWKDKQTGEQQTRTEWHRVILYNRLAEIAGEYLKKGGKAYIEGSLRTRKWQDKNGQERFTTEIIGNELQLLDSRGGPAGGFDDSMNQSSPHSQQHSAQNQAPADAVASGEDFDDDVPF